MGLKLISWSSATIADAILESYVLPYGLLLILESYEVGTDSTGESIVPPSSWSMAGWSWCQVCAVFVTGRAVGKVVGPFFGSRVDPAVFGWCVLALAAAVQVWVGSTASAADWLLLARGTTGLLTGMLCSGLLGASREEQGAWTLVKENERGKGRQRAKEIGHGLHHADNCWHAGLIVGPAIGGWMYERSLGWPWWHHNPRPALSSSVAACLFLAVMAMWQRSSLREAPRRAGGEGRRSGGATAEGRRSRGWAPWRKGGRSGSSPSQRRSPAAGASAMRGGEEGKGEDDDASAPLLTQQSEGVAAGRSPEPRGLPRHTSAGREEAMEAGEGRPFAEAEAEAEAAEVPTRYIKACAGDMADARKMWETTLRWRQETGAARLLSTPHPTLGIIKQCYPHFAHGRSRNGEVVLYESLGRMQFGRLAAAGVTPLDVQIYYAFVNEFVFERLTPSRDAQLTTVLDADGVSLFTFTNQNVGTRYLKAIGEVMRKYYPFRQSRVVVVNAPWWFRRPLKNMPGLLARGSQSDVQVLGTNFLPELLDYMDLSQIPPEFGGSSPYRLGSYPDELALRELAQNLDAIAPESDSAPNAPIRQSPGEPALPLRSGTGGTSSSSRDDTPVPPAATPAAARDVAGGKGAVDGGEVVGSSVEAVARERYGVRTSSVAGVEANDDGDDDADHHHLHHHHHRDWGGGRGGGIRQGLTQRLASVMRHMRGTASSGATLAYLGVENRFRYDEERKMWIMEGEESEGGGMSEPNGVGIGRERPAEDDKATNSDLDGWERHIVRAIQAAQEARGGGPCFGSASAGATPGVRRPRNGLNGGSGGVRSLCGLLGTGGCGSCACWLGELGSTASLVFGLQLAWAALESGMNMLLPLWMLLPEIHDGLGWSAAHTGTALSLAMTVVAFLRWVTPMACFRSLARSPIRALRMAIAAQALTAVLLSMFSTTAWMQCCRDPGTVLAVVVLAMAIVHASGIVARPALLSLLGVALAHDSNLGASGVCDESARDGLHRRHPKRAKLAIGVSKACGVLLVGLIFARAIDAGVGAGWVCFRLIAVAFLGLYFSTVFVRATDGTGGGATGHWRGAWSDVRPIACDIVEEAIDVHVRRLARGGDTSGSDSDWAVGGMVKES